MTAMIAKTQRARVWLIKRGNRGNALVTARWIMEARPGPFSNRRQG